MIPCIVTNDLKYTLPDINCTYPIKIELDENSIIGGNRPFTYTLKNNESTQVYTSSVFSVSKEGPYELTIKNTQGCEVIIKDKINISRNEDCDPVFYPNRDGIADTYYIEFQGKAKIYNREGELVKEINAPAHWDGTTNKGIEAPSGLYVIVVNENISIRVSLIR
ncbi:MAG: gliding motility-associated C-terminal domain-containing protein [Cytophagaceae bacterium]|nr:gliding motility-associated C-terminal domain-containing protein [Cytophagaceae bacterium]